MTAALIAEATWLLNHAEARGKSELMLAAAQVNATLAVHGQLVELNRLLAGSNRQKQVNNDGIRINLEGTTP